MLLWWRQLTVYCRQNLMGGTGGGGPDKCNIKVWLQKGFAHVIQVFSDSHPLCAFHTNASQIVVFFLSRVLFRMFQGERIPHYRRGELLLFATGSAGKLHALSLVFINGQCRTKKLYRHNRKASEPLHPYSSWRSSFEEHIFLQSLHVSVITEETLNVYTEASNNVQLSRLLLHQ